MLQKDIGIVIVNYNVRHFLVQCLISIKNAELQGLTTEIWVVDNASVDGSVPLIQSEFPEIQLIANSKNVGFSAANNQAIAQMNSKYILLLNPDTVVEEDTFKKCFDFMESHQDCGAVGVKLIDGAGKFLPESKRKIPDLWNSFCKLSYLSDLFPKSKFFSGYNLGYLSENQTHEIEILCGAFMFIRHEALVKTGLLDEAFFMYGEDIDLSYRIIQAGYKIYYYPETSIIHYKGESTKKSSLNYVKTFYGAMHIYVNKHYGSGNAAVFTRLITIAISIRAFLSGLSRVIAQWLRPVLDAAMVWLVLSQLKFVWAEKYFNDITYYNDTHIDKVFVVYALIWIFFMWLGGTYDSVRIKWHTISSVLLGTFLILIVYALLPETMRTSRAIILLGTVVTIITTFLTTLIWRIFNVEKDLEKSEVNVGIVAGKDNALKLLRVLKKAKVKTDDIHFFSPDNNEKDTWFTNTIDVLPKVVKALKISEIIYSSEDIPMKEIIRSMTQMENKVSFKIGGDDSLSIIGSNSKNQQGELYSLEVSYQLALPSQIRLKRVTDFVLALISIPFLPLLLVLTGFRSALFKNIFLVLIGMKTFVGYGGESVDYSFLPELKPAIIKYPISDKLLIYTQDHFKKQNMIYAKEYTVWSDLKIFFSNLYQLANKS